MRAPALLLALALTACSAEAASPEVPQAAASASAAPERDPFEERVKLHEELAAAVARLGERCPDTAKAIDRWREAHEADLAELRAAVAAAPPEVAKRAGERLRGRVQRYEETLHAARDRCGGDVGFDAAFARALPDLKDAPAPSGEIGIAECDLYLARTVSCLRGVPAEARVPFEQATAKTREAWVKASRSGGEAARDALRSACRAALDALAQNPMCHP